MNNKMIFCIFSCALFGSVGINVAMEPQDHQREELVAVVTQSVVRKCFPGVKEDYPYKSNPALLAAILSTANYHHSALQQKQPIELCHKTAYMGYGFAFGPANQLLTQEQKTNIKKLENDTNYKIAMSHDFHGATLESSSGEKVILPDLTVDKIPTMRALFDDRGLRYLYFITKKIGKSFEYTVRRVNSFSFEGDGQKVTFEETVRQTQKEIEGVDIGYEKCVLQSMDGMSVVYCGNQKIILYNLDLTSAKELLKSNKQFILAVRKGDVTINMLITDRVWCEEQFHATSSRGASLELDVDDIQTISASADPADAPIITSNPIFTGLKFVSIAGILALIAYCCKNRFSA